MTLTDNQVDEAILQMISFAGDWNEGVKQGVREYEFVSARDVLNTLGYNADVDQVLEEIARRGFNYCLDPHISSTPGDGDPFYPTADGCRWGVDQLHSRLRCVEYRPATS